MKVPFYRAEIGTEEEDNVIKVLRSGWLTTGPVTREFEAEFAKMVGAKHAIALNSCTAALHLALDALGLKAGEGVLVPSHTFAATAEVVRYFDAIPVLVDCDENGQILLSDAEYKLSLASGAKLPHAVASKPLRVVGIIPVHFAGVMGDMDAVCRFAEQHGLWVVEDAAHSFPAATRQNAATPWVRCGENTSAVTCFSFYANKTITTGEGGMAVTSRDDLAERMRLMSLHGLSRDAWNRYSGGGWDYRIVAPGFKYNLTDVASAIGVAQLKKAERMRAERERIAHVYRELLNVPFVEVPQTYPNRVHAWHLFPICLRLSELNIDRNQFVQALNDRGIGTSVHWRPLHLHNYYVDFGWKPEHCPNATARFERTLTLPLFSGMREEEIEHVATSVLAIGQQHQRAHVSLNVSSQP